MRLLNTPRNKFRISNVTFWELAILILLFLLFIIQAQYNSFGDEYDNMLGGKLINEGVLLYRDYFSHHMPLPYYLSAIINLIAGPSPLNFRYVFLIVLYLWLLYFHKDLRKLTSPALSIFFIFFITLINPVIWSHMLLAETLIAYSAIHISIFFLKILKDERKKASGTDILQIAFIGSIPVLSSLGFWAISFFYYIFFFLFFSRYYLNSKFKDYHALLKFITVYSTLILLPYVLFFIHFTYGRILNDFYLYNIIFNQEYYSVYNNHIPKNNTQMFIDLFVGIFNSFAIDLKHLSDFPNTSYRLILRVFVYSYVGLNLLIKNKLVGIFFLFSYFLLNIRQGDVYIVNNFHEIQTMLFAILCITLSLDRCFKSINLKEVYLNFQKYILIVNIFLLVIFMGFLFGFNRDVLKAYRNDTMPKVLYKETSLNKIINSSGAKSVWIGPGQFEEYFFLEPKVASKYYYWFPWHNSCPSCKSEIVQDFNKNKPEIIYWDNNKVIWGIYNSKDFGKDISNFLEEYYYTEDHIIYKLKK